jgi:hypothetical protein
MDQIQCKYTFLRDQNFDINLIYEKADWGSIFYVSLAIIEYEIKLLSSRIKIVYTDQHD